MKSGIIVVTLASALTAVACTRSETAPKQDPATGSSRTAAPSRGANPNAAAPQDVAPTVANSPGVADQTKEADNTGINERDRRTTTTPVDQGSSAAETNITASIRKDIMADEKLSFTGKNVKVITVGSKVTLRGPVESEQAKVAIADLARRTTGVSEVDNQLEVVKSTTSSK